MANNNTFSFGEEILLTSIILDIADGRRRGILTQETRARVIQCSDAVANIAKSDKAVYGINTGFGPLCTSMISAEDTRKLQENLLKSHAVGTGLFISERISKIMLILKAHALSKGFSGVSVSLLERILWHIENDVIPVVPEKGSVGASGDLAPLSHLFLPLIGEGMVYYKSTIRPAAEVLKHFGLGALELGPKEGLALINGTQFMAAHCVEAVARMYHLLVSADTIGAMTVDALQGSLKPFRPEIHDLRRYHGNIAVAKRVSSLLEGSKIADSHIGCGRVQDPYSLRCIPQVHGASWNAWLHLKDTLEIEINSVTDNPLVFSEDLTISGGNFHGQPIALPMDYACLAASELGNIADRRIYLMLEGNAPGVPKLLMKETGLNSGFMIVQYTTAALASENKSLCFPASADSIPTSLGQEDHVSMGSISARKLLQVIDNVERILGIELFCATQAIDFHRPLVSGEKIEQIHAMVRERIPHIDHDQILHEYMDTATQLVKTAAISHIAGNQDTVDQKFRF